MKDVYPENKAVRISRDAELEVTKILVCPEGGHYCGYVRFNERPVLEEGYAGILTYVPVHGGITYAQEDSQGMVYGFDCAHLHDETDVRFRDETFLLEECRRLALAIKIAAKWEPAYLSYSTENPWRIHVVDGYLERLANDFDIQQTKFNFGTVLAILSGQI